MSITINLQKGQSLLIFSQFSKALFTSIPLNIIKTWIFRDCFQYSLSPLTSEVSMRKIKNFLLWPCFWMLTVSFCFCFLFCKCGFQEPLVSEESAEEVPSNGFQRTEEPNLIDEQQLGDSESAAFEQLDNAGKLMIEQQLLTLVEPEEQPLVWIDTLASSNKNTANWFLTFHYIKITKISSSVKDV